MEDRIDTIDPEDIPESPGDKKWNGPSTFRALRHKDFTLYWVGLAISTVGTWMQSIAQGWLVYDLTGRELYLGLVTAMSTLPVLLLVLPAGVIADRFNKRRIVIITQTIAMILTFVLAALTIYGSIRPWHLMVFASMLGIVNAIDIPARQSMTIELVGKEDIHNAVALTSSAFNGARLVGPAVAGEILKHYGAGTCFFINGISYIAVVTGLLMIRNMRVTNVSSSSRSVISEVKEGIAYARKNSLIRDLLILTGAASIFALQYTSQMPAYAKRVLNVGPEGLGSLVSAAGLGALVGAIVVASVGHKFKTGVIVTFGSILAPLAITALSFVNNYYVALICMAAIGYGVIMLLAVSNSLIMVSSPDELRGRVLSVRTLVFLGLAPVGAFQVGFVAEYMGVQQSLRIGGILCLIISMYFALRSKSIRGAE